MRRPAGRAIAAFAVLMVLGAATSGAAQPHQLSLRFSEWDFTLDGAPAQDPRSSLQLADTPALTAMDRNERTAADNFAMSSTATERDWEGLKHDTAYFLGYQFVIIGLLYIMPENISSWSEEEKEKYSFGKWKNNISGPVKDEDDHFINYVLHPYWGAAYYVRARERGYPAWNAFGYSVVLSTLYEYGAEALFEPVSAQDLIVTPVAGSLLGRFVFEEVRGRIKRRPLPLSFSDRFLLVVTDPLGAASVLAEELLGRNAEASLSLDLTPRKGQGGGDYVGLRLVFNW